MLILLVFLLTQNLVAKDLQGLRFSNTQSIKTIKTYHPDLYSPELFSKIKLIPPPANTSAETKEELKELIALKANRTPKKIREIKAQRHAPWVFGPFEMANFEEDDPIFQYVRGAMRPAAVLAFKFKKEFDRVRPSFLNPEINPVVKVPKHASYPSAHAAQAYVAAYALIEIAPEFKKEILHSAEQLSRNRELAGVHYKSDTDAGIALAKKTFEVLNKEASFKLFQAAAKEQYLSMKDEIKKDYEESEKYRE